MMHDPPFDPGCTGKAQYVSKADAIRCLRGVNKRLSTKGGRGGVHPYRCDRCKRWHIGSNSFRNKELRK
jgi:hypothetical protein